MKRIIYYILPAALLATACTRTTDIDGGKGYGVIAIAAALSAQTDADNGSPFIYDGPFTPNESNLALTVTDADGVTRQWDSVAEYNAEEHYFAAGEYDIELSYGDSNDEGYDKPCYAGTAHVVVKPRTATNATVTVAIANSLVIIECSDNFGNYFPEADFKVVTEADNTFDVQTPMDEPLFVSAGQTFTIECTARKQTGETVVFPPESIGITQPRTRYIVKYDVAQAGGAMLTISLNDQPVEVIDIENELNDKSLPD